jgi:vacuolar-type H+-ATPase subunit H
MSFFGDIYAGKAEQKAANYNAKIIESNKKIKLEEAKQIMSVHNEFNLPKFDKTVEEIQGAATTDYATSGVELSGTPVEVLYENELSLQRDRDTMTFNAENARDRSENEAIMMQAEADLQRYRGKVAKKRSYFEAGSSLLNDAATIQGMRT